MRYILGPAAALALALPGAASALPSPKRTNANSDLRGIDSDPLRPRDEVQTAATCSPPTRDGRLARAQRSGVMGRVPREMWGKHGARNPLRGPCHRMAPVEHGGRPCAGEVLLAPDADGNIAAMRAAGHQGLISTEQVLVRGWTAARRLLVLVRQTRQAQEEPRSDAAHMNHVHIE